VRPGLFEKAPGGADDLRQSQDADAPAREGTWWNLLGGS